MKSLLEPLLTSAELWAERRRRAAELSEVYPHAGEMLTLYAALCEVQSAAHLNATRTAPGAAELAPFVVAEVLPGILAVALASGPSGLKEQLLDRFHAADLENLVTQWLRGEALAPAEAFLGRAATSPVLEALPALAAATGTPAADGRHCPVCGAAPQLSYFAPSPEALVTGPRYLLCSHCSSTWVHPRLCCAGCGCTDSGKLPIFSDPAHFAHLRIDACDECHHYLVNVDLPKDLSAVPVVDEIVALPLDLFARERGFTKITPNLMGF